MSVTPEEEEPETQSSSPRTLSSPSAVQNNQEKALYITFFCLTTTFLLCHTPRIILNIYEVPMSIERDICMKKYNRHYFQPIWVLILAYFEKLSLILNSSINFVFYCLAGQAFRQQMYKVIFSKVVRICMIVSDVLSTDKPSEGYGGIPDSRRQDLTRLEHQCQSDVDLNTGTCTGTATMDTGMATNTTITEMSETSTSRYYRMKFQRQMRSFEEHRHDLGTIKETVAIVEPLTIDVEQAVNTWLVGSHPNLLLTVSMPCGTFTESQGTSMSQSQPNLKVTLSVSNSFTKVEDQANNHNDEVMNEYDDDNDKDYDDGDDTISSCSAGSNSSCGSSYDESCPHCVIMSSSKPNNVKEHEKEVFV